MEEFWYNKTGAVYEFKREKIKNFRILGWYNSAQVAEAQKAQNQAQNYMNILATKTGYAYSLGTDWSPGVIDWGAPPKLIADKYMLPQDDLISYNDYQNYPGAVLYDVLKNRSKQPTLFEMSTLLTFTAYVMKDEIAMVVTGLYRTVSGIFALQAEAGAMAGSVAVAENADLENTEALVELESVI